MYFFLSFESLQACYLTQLSVRKLSELLLQDFKLKQALRKRKIIELIKENKIDGMKNSNA